MDVDQAKLLRKPFEKKLIQQIPKGGRKLDYVSHASTTDRLLQVDPEWTWRPMSFDAETGVPGLDSEGNLWIWLDVAGVTTPGVGDGPSMKEKIGDAIRNAAMRRGVALDLWAQVDLDQPVEAAPADHLGSGQPESKISGSRPFQSGMKPSQAPLATPSDPVSEPMAAHPPPGRSDDRINQWQLKKLADLAKRLREVDPLSEILVRWDEVDPAKRARWSQNTGDEAIKVFEKALIEVESLGIPLRPEPDPIPQ